MVSRRRILSRSRDDLNLDSTFVAQQEEEDDVWYNKDKLYKVSPFAITYSRKVSSISRLAVRRGKRPAVRRAALKGGEVKKENSHHSITRAGTAIGRRCCLAANSRRWFGPPRRATPFKSARRDFAGLMERGAV